MKVVDVVLAGTMVLAAACGAKSNGEGEVDAGDVGAMCTDSTECGANAPICTAAGVCVQCESSADCSGDTPVCSNQTCNAACAGDEATADFVTRPSDIIFVVDQSGSMNQETVHVQQKINDFVTLISASNVDYRVVMIARTTPSNAICVPAPLGGASCGNNTQFRLVDQYVDSRNGPAVAISTYSQYSDFLRPDSIKHFVFVTDDDSNQPATTFTNAVANLLPANSFDGYKVHGIYAYGNGMANGCTGAFGSGARDGTIYTTLVAQTMGARGVICTGDWTQVFTDITEAVVTGSQVACSFTIPAPAMGVLDPSQVNVRYQAGGVAPGQTLPQVPTAGDCAGSGWYYDDNTAPTTITLCPDTCTAVQADDAANIKIELGCSTQIF